MAMRSGTHAPSHIFVEFRAKNAPSTNKNRLPKSVNFQVGHSHTACATISKRHVVTRNVPVTASPYAFASKFDEGKPITSATTPVRSIQLIAGIQICPDRKSTRLNSSHVAISYA